MGRGILVDLYSWRQKQDEPALREFNCFETSSIPLKDIKACLAAQGTEVKFGDILFTRTGKTPVSPRTRANTHMIYSQAGPTGWHAQHAQLPESQLKAYQAVFPHRFGGVEQSEEMIRWVWDNFSAVAGDQPSFEAWPSREDWALHEVLLAGYGCPIGELFWLEGLAETCAREGRWSFFVASEPCNVPGGVASPPNILAIF